jgi:hypothetical protein
MESEDEDEAFQIITEGGVDYLVDMETFIVSTVEDDAEVGTWDDETQSILYFGDALPTAEEGAEDGPLPAQPEAEAQPGGEAEDGFMVVECPLGMGPGSLIVVEWAGGEIEVEVPEGVAPGDEFEIELPETSL